MSDQPSLFDWSGNAAPKNKRLSQRDKIAKALTAGMSLTPLDALNLWGCFRLAARIHELRARGMNIVEEDIAHDGGRHARYFLEAHA